jgi:hypothetical protein
MSLRRRGGSEAARTVRAVIPRRHSIKTLLRVPSLREIMAVEKLDARAHLRTHAVRRSPTSPGNAACFPHGSSLSFARCAMGAEFFNPFDPRSPEGLIYQFRDKHCCSMSYLSCAPGSNVDMIKHDSFTLPFDTFLRSVSKFNPVIPSLDDHDR